MITALMHSSESCMWVICTADGHLGRQRAHGEEREELAGAVAAQVETHVEIPEQISGLSRFLSAAGGGFGGLNEARELVFVDGAAPGLDTDRNLVSVVETLVFIVGVAVQEPAAGVFQTPLVVAVGLGVVSAVGEVGEGYIAALPFHREALQTERHDSIEGFEP